MAGRDKRCGKRRRPPPTPSTPTPTGPVVGSIDLSPADMTLQAGGLAAAVGITVLDTNGNPLVGQAVQMVIQGNDKISVNNSGLVSPIAPGGASFYAVIGNVQSNTVNVTVEAAPTDTTPFSVDVTPTFNTLNVGQTVQLQAVVKNAAGDVLNAPVVWASVDSTKVAVDQNGLVTAIGPTSTNTLVSATTTNGKVNYAAFSVTGSAGGGTGTTAASFDDTVATNSVAEYTKTTAAVLTKDAVTHVATLSGGTFSALASAYRNDFGPLKNVEVIFDRPTSPVGGFFFRQTSPGNHLEIISLGNGNIGMFRRVNGLVTGDEYYANAALVNGVNSRYTYRLTANEGVIRLFITPFGGAEVEVTPSQGWPDDNPVAGYVGFISDDPNSSVSWSHFKATEILPVGGGGGGGGGGTPGPGTGNSAGSLYQPSDDPWVRGYSKSVPGSQPLMTLPQGVIFDAVHDMLQGHPVDFLTGPASGSVISVPDTGNPQTNGVNLQNAVNAAATTGRIFELTPGAFYDVSLVIPQQATRTGWHTFRPTNYASLPADGVRITPTLAGTLNLPRIRALHGGGDGAINCVLGAHHCRFEGIYFTNAPGILDLSQMIWLGPDTATSESLISHHFLFKHCVFLTPDTVSCKRAIMVNATDVGITDSWFEMAAGTSTVGEEGQTFTLGNGALRGSALNCFLAAAGENVMSGGVDTTNASMIPADWEIRGSHFYKYPRWAPTALGGTAHRQMKNILEIKMGKRLLFEGNIYENSYADAQAGFGVIYWTVNQGGGSAWNVTENITDRYNIIRNIRHGYQISDRQYMSIASQLPLRANSIDIKHVLIELLGEIEASNGWLLQLQGRVDNLKLNHITAHRVDRIITFVQAPTVAGQPAAVGDRSANFMLKNSVFGSTTGTPNMRTDVSNNSLENIASMFDPAPAAPVIVGNVNPGGDANGNLPPGNYRPATNAAIGFKNYSAGAVADPEDLSLDVGSPYLGLADDGSDPGCDMFRLKVATAGVAAF